MNAVCSRQNGFKTIKCKINLFCKIFHISLQWQNILQHLSKCQSRPGLPTEAHCATFFRKTKVNWGDSVFGNKVCRTEYCSAIYSQRKVVLNKSTAQQLDN